MTQPEKSDVPEAGAMRDYYCILEFTWQGQMVISQAMVQWARNERQAAERCAGMQLARECVPRRIRVYTQQPVDFQWTRVDNYLGEVGEVER